eukprot:CAMPEP_0172621530 /NCGR_PEP_ID=MMETSP1068-20121228/113017_1 /TAXON_ID=35684 /ORGANISM="Pseudopedinella elastica, Strain CCMP716" /LENGTH=97 /DNA_ID=CAMNT_0013429315 /DNA_START=166 /DNA_END=455 /DNA_ORIENTATION=+
MTCSSFVGIGQTPFSSSGGPPPQRDGYNNHGIYLRKTRVRTSESTPGLVWNVCAPASPNSRAPRNCCFPTHTSPKLQSQCKKPNSFSTAAGTSFSTP